MAPASHLPSVAHVDVGAHGLEGPSATGQQVGAVVGLQQADVVCTLALKEMEAQAGWTIYIYGQRAQKKLP